MTGKTHAAMGMATSYAIAKTIGVSMDITTDALVLSTGAFAGFLPDIDHQGSTLGRRFKWIAIFLKHRGITHTIYFMGFIYVIGIWLGLDTWLNIAIVGALFSHLIGDWMTPDGIKPFKLASFFDYTFRCPIAINKIPFAEESIQLLCFVCIFLMIKGAI